jgi:hypothetical protein
MKELIRMNQLAGNINENQARKMLRILDENKTYSSSIIKEERTFADVDREMAAAEIQDMEKAKTFLNSPQGKNAVKMLKQLISRPYGYDKLEEVLQILNLSVKNFKYAAKAAGMEFGEDGGGIKIYDDNYQDQDVSISHMNGEWMVG